MVNSLASGHGRSPTMAVRTTRLAATIAPLVLLATCRPSASTVAWEDRDPAYVLDAIRETRQADDRSRIRVLVDQLDNDDPAVRMLAINVLEDFTGETYGYRYTQPRAERRAAIDRWVEAIERGEVTIDGSTGTAGSTGATGSGGGSSGGPGGGPDSGSGGTDAR